ncbi:SpoIIE family protein phosphatase [Streptomyces sp. TRM 70361]|uniref:SpoIIE family protein phosphatase n=1 Tax=Streptomyces sp. TRM 70361 TaxID=3116553 RepID=UPI002E7B5095|nr:SpoIIE family protein phosphatase [Streptomyces sp. TRM 70361]MEE1939239.1 SpoIIE family protein phosphatase [Streptomyces sp. TRM 70361]
MDEDGVSDTPRAFRSAADRVATSLLDTLRVGIVMFDTRGYILLWSPTTEEILGWPSEHMIGQYYVDYLTDIPVSSDGDLVGPGDFYSVLSHEKYWRGILRVRHPDGHTVEVEGRASLITPAEGSPFILANLVETSRLRTVEQDLAALDALFATSPLGIAVFDTEHRYIRVNEALARLDAKPADEIVGRTVHEVLPGHMADQLARLQSLVLRTGRPVVDSVVLAPDGHGWRSVSYGRLTAPDGRVLGISSTVMDVTERREALEKMERARQRLKLLDDIGVVLGDLLDVHRIADALAGALVPRLTDYASVMLYGAVAHGGELPRSGHLPDTPLLQLGTAARHRGPAVDSVLRVGREIAFAPDSVFGEVLGSTVPHLMLSEEELLSATYPGDPTVRVTIDLGVHAVLVVPLRARGIILGLLVLSRGAGRPAFDRDDLALTMELAGRAGTSLDNARLYARERESALMLQRSLLPQHVPSPAGVRVAYRYVPGGSRAEPDAAAGGDWFDVIPLAGGRVAFVVGDVMGHGLRAAATMGRLRTAVRTLAGLDLPPDELLRRVDELADDLVQGPDEPLMATCAYVVYDPSTRRCTFTMAGHVPPLLLHRSAGHWTAVPVEAPPGTPLGVGGVPYESLETQVEEGSVLVLYTDGLIEHRGEDITDGLDRLAALLGALPAHPRLEDICDRVLTDLGVGDGASPDSGGTGGVDDVALLLAQLGGLPEGSTTSWTFPAETYAVRRARDAVRRALRGWGLDALVDDTALLVSELVTNSLRHAHGPIGVRMVRGSSLLVEVSDPLPVPPRERTATADDEGGRGIQLVARAARRWGTRYGPIGKTVWFELPLR